MARHGCLTSKLIRALLLIGSGGAVLVSTGTSCGDQLRATVMDAGVNFVGEATGLLLESAMNDLLNPAVDNAAG